MQKRKDNNKKKNEKAEKAVDGDEDELVLCLLTIEIKKENVKKKVWFVENDILLDHQIKTCISWVARARFLHETGEERVQSATALQKKIINDHNELEHPSNSITHAISKDMGIKVTGTFKAYEDSTLGKAKQQGVSKKTVTQSKPLEERLFFNISLPSTPTLGGKKHWLLVVNDRRNNIWIFFLKEKSDLVDVLLGLIKNLKNKYDLQLQ